MKSYLDTKLLIYQEKNKQKIHFTASLYQFRAKSLFLYGVSTSRTFFGENLFY